MNVKEAITTAVAKLGKEQIGPPRMAAETLLMHVLRRDRAFLHAHPERELTNAEADAFADAVARRAEGIPLQYITGKQEFYGLEFVVSRAVLIPRPETEHLVEAALEIASDLDVSPVRIVDVGTGSGCVILAIAHNLSRTGRQELHATDISEDALVIAKQNADRLGLSGRVTFHETDLLSAIADQNGTFDIVVSNPPYVGLDERDKVQREVRDHEPAVAVFGGQTGMDIYQRLIPQSHSALHSGGYLLLEIGYSIEAQVRSLLNANQWRGIRSIPDLQGIPRVVVARKR